MNKGQIKVCLLYNQAMYKKMVNLWYTCYLSIQGSIAMNFKEAKTYNHYLISMGIRALGGMDKVFEHLESWAVVNKVKPQTKKNNRTSLEKIFSHAKKNKLIKELDRKIKFEKEFYL